MQVNIVLDGEGAFPELMEEIKSGNLEHGVLSDIAALPQGMQSGRTSVTFVFTLESGRRVMAETSLRMFQMAAAAFTGRYGDET